MSRLLRTILFCILTGASVLAQSPASRPWWISFGGGPAVADGVLDMAAGVVYGSRFESSVLSARIIGATNDNPTVRRWSPTPWTYKLTDYGILYGPVWDIPGGIVSAGAGIGLVRTAVSNGSLVEKKSSMSLPLEAQVLWRISDFFGAGLYGYASINGARTFPGMFLTVQLGAFRHGR